MNLKKEINNPHVSIIRYRVDTGHPVELKYTPEVGQPTKTCHRLLQDPPNLDVIQTLPKTNSILSIISNDLHIQVRSPINCIFQAQT